MSDTYTQIRIQAVFAVKHSKAQIAPEWEGRLYEYIGGILKSEGHQPLIVNGMPDHIHILFGLNPDQSLSKAMQTVKAKSSKWINQQGFCSQKFAWQRGYGAFSYGESQREVVYNYIANQKEHHRKRTFREEFVGFLKRFGIPFETKYLPEEV